MDPNRPHAIELVAFDENKTLHLNIEPLQQALLRTDIKDLPVAVVSIAGAFRLGKSFLLSFFVRYLNVTYVQGQENEEWLLPEDGPLKGFEWKSGTRSHTNGIMMWSQVFIAQKDNGEQVAILLLDTQGAFDFESSFTDCTKIFALSTLLSSVQIFNVTRMLKQDDVQHLEVFANFGIFLDNHSTPPFPKLTFLVRDWACPDERPYGAEGGLDYMKDIISKNTSSSPIKAILEYFEGFNCFLLPHPGMTVATSSKFEGDLTEIDNSFKKHIQDFVPQLMAKENLQIKKVNGELLTAKDFVEYAQTYVNLFRDSVPSPQTIYQANITMGYERAMESAMEHYKFEIGKRVTRHQAMEEVYFDKQTQQAKYAAIEVFKSSNKLEDEETENKFMKMLEKEIEIEYFKYQERNEKLLEDSRQRERDRLKQQQQRQQEQRQQEQRRQEQQQQGLDVDWGTVGTAAAVVGTMAVGSFALFKMLSKDNNKK